VLPFSCVAPVAPGTGPRLRPLCPTSGGVASGPSGSRPTAPRTGGESKRPLVKGRKVDPSAVPPTFGDAALLADGSGSRALWHDSCRSVLPCIAGALRRSLLASPGSSRFGPVAHGAIRSCRRPSFHQPLGLCAGNREVLVPIIARIPMWRGVYVQRRVDVKRGRLGYAWYRRPRSGLRRQRRTAAHQSRHLLTPVAGGRVAASRRHRFGGWDPRRTGIHAHWAASGPSSEAMRPEHRLVVLAPCYPDLHLADSRSGNAAWAPPMRPRAPPMRPWLCHAAVALPQGPTSTPRYGVCRCRGPCRARSRGLRPRR
jgi:hypothetical protein